MNKILGEGQYDLNSMKIYLQLWFRMFVWVHIYGGKKPDAQGAGASSRERPNQWWWWRCSYDDHVDDDDQDEDVHDDHVDDDGEDDDHDDDGNTEYKGHLAEIEPTNDEDF